LNRLQEQPAVGTGFVQFGGNPFEQPSHHFYTEEAESLKSDPDDKFSNRFDSGDFKAADLTAQPAECISQYDDEDHASFQYQVAI
jgi:hypothetical protein